jgi:anti-anti-sigma factor
VPSTDVPRCDPPLPTSGRPSSPDLTVDVRWIGRRAVVRLGGEIDIGTREPLCAALDHAASAGALEIWVDLSDVRFMDSTGLNALLELRDRVARLAVICPEGSARRTFELTGLDDVFSLYPTRAQAHFAA